jgi:hypothetical protein
MKRTAALGVCVPALAVVFLAASVSGAFGQDPRGGGGQGGGATAAARGGGDAGGARGGGVASAPAPTSSGGSTASPVFGGSGVSGGASGASAVPRGGRVENGGGRPAGVGNPRWGEGRAAGTSGGGTTEGAFGRPAIDDQMAGRTRVGGAASGAESSVPWYARSRGGNPSTGNAVARPDVPVGGGGGGYPTYPWYPWYPGYPGYGGGYGGWYDCYYSPYYGCGNPWGYGGFGLGYFYFNPFGWNYGDYAWGGGGGGGGSYGGAQMGSIRLRVKPNTASVYVDGYYAGTVDDFDNTFQKLSIALGKHRIEISAPGYQPLIIEIDVRDFDTINYEGRLEPIR